MRRATIVAIVALSAACSSKPAPPPPAPVVAPTPVPTPAAPAVGAVALGNSIGTDKTVSAPAETFAVSDTIYASVATSGSGHIKLRALWSFVKGDKTAKVNENTIEFDSAGPAANEFHVQNSKGWPKGDYRVEIFLGDGAEPAATRAFKVQ
jgi:hypothetical protein